MMQVIDENIVRKLVNLILSEKDSKEDIDVMEEMTYDEMLNMQIAPEGELLKWNYTLDESNNSVTIKNYIDTNVIDTFHIYDKYTIDGKEYYTTFLPLSAMEPDTNSPIIDDENVRANVVDIIIHNNVNNKYTNLNGFFWGMNKLKSIDFGTGPKLTITEMNYTFRKCSSIDASLVKNMPDTSNVTTFDYCFTDSSFDPKLISNFSFESCTSMLYSFANSLLSIIDLSRFKFLNKVSMQYTFCITNNSTVLKDIKLPIIKSSSMKNTFTKVQFNEYPDTISNIDVSSCINYMQTFNGTNLEIVDLSNWQFPESKNVTTVATQMFANMPNLKEVRVNQTWKNITNKSYTFKNSPITDVTYVD